MKLLITVEGKSYEVDVQVLDETGAPGGGSTSAPAPRSAPSVGAAASAAPGPRAAAPAPAAPSAGGGGSKVLKAPIVGTVVKLLVKPGDAVTKNQPLLVMEAMKMETNIAAHDAAVVKAIKVTAGQAVKAGDVLVEFE